MIRGIPVSDHQAQVLRLMLRGHRLAYLRTSQKSQLLLPDIHFPLKQVTVQRLADLGAIHLEFNQYILTDQGRAWAEALGN